MANHWEPYHDASHLFQPLWLPTVAQLDAYETQAGFRLPESYQEIPLAFG